MEDPKNKLLLQLTGQEFIDLLKEGLALSLETEPIPNDVPKHYVYGLAGLCKLLGISTATASRIKRSGVIDPAISQYGKSLIIDADLAIDLLKVRKNKRFR